MPRYVFIPAILGAVTDVAVYFLIRSHQPDYPVPLVAYQLTMFWLALMFATPYRKVWILALILMFIGIFVAGFSVGFLYLPTAGASLWVMARRYYRLPLEDQPRS